MLLGGCEGQLSCQGCAIHVTKNYDLLEPPSQLEKDLLRQLYINVEKYYYYIYIAVLDLLVS